MSFLQHAVQWMQAIQSAGWIGYLMFIALYAACCVFFVPASFLTFAAGAVWGFWGGLALVLAGNGLGSLVCLLITRYLLHDWAERHFQKNERLRAVAEAAQHDGWKIVFLTRLSPLMPYSLINYALGLTNLSAWRFIAATEVGSIPATAVYVYLGTVMGSLATIRTDLHSHGPVRWALQGGGLATTILITIYVTHLANRSLKKRIDSAAPSRDD